MEHLAWLLMLCSYPGLFLLLGLFFPLLSFLCNKVSILTPSRKIQNYDNKAINQLKATKSKAVRSAQGR